MSETEFASEDAGALAEDNKRLQEMLHSALRREAEALRRVKHLSELLSECRVRTPSSGPELGAVTDSVTVEGQWSRREDWETAAGSWEDRDGSAPQSQRSEHNQSPSLVVSPPLTSTESSGTEQNSQFIFPTVMSAPTPLTPLHTDVKESLAPSDMDISTVTEEVRTHSHPPTPPNDVGPAGLLVPAMRTSGDIRKERERPPPSNPTAYPTDTAPLVSREWSTPSRVAEKLQKTVTLGRTNRFNSLQPLPDQPAPRSRASSLLKPSWLRKRSYSLVKKTKPHLTPGPAATIPDMFSHFLEHSAHISPHSLSQYIDQPWTEVCRSAQCSVHVGKYRSAVWELFQSETKYLCKQLQPLEQVYKAFLEELQFYGFLAIADVQKIFANLSELVELSVSMATDLFQLFVGRHGDMIAPTNELILAFSMFGHKWNPVYQRFCVNVEQQRGFVKALQQIPDFREYITVCRGHSMVQRSDLTDFLIAPMQHQCHYQLLLENVLKVTSEPSEKSLLTSAIKAFVVALRELQANIAAHQRSVELLELQETLSWPVLATLCPDSYIPEGLSLDHQPCGDRLATPSRQLLHTGPLRLIDNRGRHGSDIQLFLFTDMILLTVPRSKSTRKESTRKELSRYTVYKQPMVLQLLEVHTLSSPKHCLTLVQRNGLHQLVTIYTLQASSADERDKWDLCIRQAQHSFCHND